MVFLACWFAFPILFFSISDSKLAGYILPSLPPLALILGVYLSKTVDRSRLKAAAIVELLLALAIAIAAPIVFQKEYGGAWKTGLLVSVAIAIPSVFSIVLKWRGRSVQALGATIVQGVLIVVVLAQFAFPVLGAFHSTRDIAHRALELRQPGEPIVGYRFFHHTLHYYTGYQIQDKLDDADSLLQFARQHSSFLAVTNVEGMKEIKGMKISAVPLAEQGNFRLVRVGAGSAGETSNAAHFLSMPLPGAPPSRRLKVLK
jgi:hypothetical protein